MGQLKRTQFAQAAVDFSDFFAMDFTNLQVGGSVVRRPALMAPEGMSTAGGKQSLQHITLQPEQPTAPVLTVGWVDLTKRAAQLRTLPALEQVYRQRFNQPLMVDAASYQAFLQRAHQFFTNQGMTLQYESTPAAASLAPAARNNNTNVIVLLVVAVMGLLVIAVAGVLGYLLFVSG